MGFQLIGGDTTNTSAIVNQVNQNIAQLKVQDVTNIFKDDTGTRRVLLGKGKDGFYGMKVSQAGTDVYDGADEDMVFNSDNNLFKIALTGTTSLTPPASWDRGDEQVATIPHGLSYKPAFLVYVENPNISGAGYYVPGLSIVPSTIHLIASYDVVFASFAYVDETNLYINLQYFNSAGSSPAAGFDIFTWNYKYYILQETAN